MAVISVEAASLGWLDTECERVAATVVAPAPAVSAGLGATTAAVRALHSDVSGAGRRIADRLRSTGERISNVGGRFGATEAANEDVLREI